MEVFMAVLSVQGLTKNYGQNQGIFDFDLEVCAGDRILLLGPNGAGKTTAFKGILGLQAYDAGIVRIDGCRWDENPVSALEKVGAMVAKPSFYNYMTGYQNLRVLGRAYTCVGEAEVREAIRAVELDDFADQKVSTYSTGMLQRLDLAKAIMHRPKLLILDEPFSGVDIEVKYTLKRLLERFQRERELGIVLSSHMANEVEGFANRVVMIYQGRTLFSGAMEVVHRAGVSLEEHYLNVLRCHKERQEQYAKESA
jgi:ABC-type multidrug transport system ATPase subunit